MPDQDASPPSRTFTIVFPENSALPVVYVNAVQVLAGPTEFFITLGTVLPPEVKSVKDFEQIDTLAAQPVARFAMSLEVVKQFIDVLSQQYELRHGQGARQGVLNEERDADG